MFILWISAFGLIYGMYTIRNIVENDSKTYFNFDGYYQRVY